MPRDLYKNLYDAEWTRRDQLQSAVGTPLTAITLLGSALVVLSGNWNTAALVWPLVFRAALLGAGATFAIAVYKLVRSYHNYVYERIPFSSQLHTYESDLRQYYAATAGNPDLAGVEFEAELERRYILAADVNSQNNIRRGEYLHQANWAIVWAVVFTATAAVPLALTLKDRTPNAAQIEITNLRELATPLRFPTGG